MCAEQTVDQCLALRLLGARTHLARRAGGGEEASAPTTAHKTWVRVFRPAPSALTQRLALQPRWEDSNAPSKATQHLSLEQETTRTLQPRRERGKQASKRAPLATEPPTLLAADAEEDEEDAEGILRAVRREAS